MSKLKYLKFIIPSLIIFNSPDLYWQSRHSLETRAELAVLRSYGENQAILKPILLYRTPKCKQTKEQGSEDCLWTHIFIVGFFSFFCQDANKARSNCAIIGCNLSKKHKLTLYKTQNGGPIVYLLQKDQEYLQKI